MIPICFVTSLHSLLLSSGSQPRALLISLQLLHPYYVARGTFLCQPDAISGISRRLVGFLKLLLLYRFLLYPSDIVTQIIWYRSPEQKQKMSTVFIPLQESCFSLSRCFCRSAVLWALWRNLRDDGYISFSSIHPISLRREYGTGHRSKNRKFQLPLFLCRNRALFLESMFLPTPILGQVKINTLL